MANLAPKPCLGHLEYGETCSEALPVFILVRLGQQQIQVTSFGIEKQKCGLYKSFEVAPLSRNLFNQSYAKSSTSTKALNWNKKNIFSKDKNFDFKIFANKAPFKNFTAIFRKNFLLKMQQKSKIWVYGVRKKFLKVT